MKPLIVLLGSFVALFVTCRLFKGSYCWTFSGCLSMSLMLVFTAIAHFAFTKGMAAMMPSFLPWKLEMVLATGALELLFAVGLLVPKYRSLTAWLLIVFFLLILPANIHAAIAKVNYQTGGHDGPGLAYLWFRVPLQLFFISWVWWFGVKG